MQFEVLVALKPDVFDPEAHAIHETFSRLGYERVKSIKIRRSFVIEIDETDADSGAMVEELAECLLTNPSSHEFVLRKIEA